MTQKKAALLKEKEKLDIADTNALLFHPNQFSINHSASPGGPQSNRKTRHARHRLEVEEWDLVAGNNKRKRKLPTDTENGSPAPAGRDIDTTNQLKEASGKPEAHQMATRLYSVDRLFSEKELNAVTQQASYDVINLHRAKKRKIDDFQATAASLITTNAESSEIEDNVIAEPNLGTDGAIEEVSLIALDMERTATNASYHATRSTRAVTLSNGLSTRESLGDLAGREAAVGLIGTYQKERKREEEYQRAPPVTELEAELDMALIEAAMKDEYSKAEKMLDDFLEDREDHVGGESIANGDVEVEDN